MGLDIWQESKRCKECNHMYTSENLSCTYNLSLMWRAIYPDAAYMVDIDEMTGKQAQKRLQYAIDELKNNPDKFKQYNPANGWGSYDGFIVFLEKLLVLSYEHPERIWKTWR